MSSEASGKEKDSGVNGSPVNPAGLRKPLQSTQEKLRNELYSPKKPQSNLSVNAPEFVPRKGLYEGFQDLQIGEYYIPTAEDVLNSFQETLTALISQPGNMEELMRVVIDQMKQLPESEQSILDRVIDMLFEQCVTEPNFRYTGARLCKLLCKELKSHPIFKNFRSAFLTRCKAEYLKKEEMIANPETVDRLCGFTMFIGELFLNLEAEKEVGGNITFEKIGILRSPVLKDLLLILLQHPTDFTVKCATQLLKLTGSTIEDTAYLNPTPEGSYDEVFLQIRQLDSYPDLNRTSKCLIKSVIDLKDNNWGRSRSSNPATPEESYQPVYQQAAEFTQNEPVFYNQQGQPITAEEAGYYDQAYDTYLQEEEEEYARWEAEGFEEQNPWVEGGDYQAWSSDPNQLEYDNGYYQTGPYSENYMDEEIEAAYEEFLRQQPPPPQ
ncbi:polyadenylate-binding protein-interacting protein 1-like isoform X2 [Saccostrea echinata]|uniref:polyadenylate-binding protein-interacting protein 1-like isoform X2 n=1 Tax=Saccostrea echinata TaxID=191078 RepID=UPI002A7F0CE3|nr:polyadenylate-binding protein-interacting protein 1-like isoform X2 [Saccostrea echinata]